VESNKVTTEAAYALAQREQRIAALNGLTEATIELRTLLRFVPNQIDVEEMQSCRAQMLAWRRHLPDVQMPYCDELAANETPWDNTVTITNTIANALNEINKALGQG
jgi:hypothetical protein